MIYFFLKNFNKNLLIYLIINFLNLGSSIGIISIFRIYEKDNRWVKITDLFDHNKDISNIFISNTLNVLATACIDGFVNLYTFPNFHFLRAIKLDNNITADYVFLSNSPLPCVAIYSRSNYTFYVYSVNGKKIYSDIVEEQGILLSPQVFTDISFNDFLVNINILKSKVFLKIFFANF